MSFICQTRAEGQSSSKTQWRYISFRWESSCVALLSDESQGRIPMADLKQPSSGFLPALSPFFLLDDITAHERNEEGNRTAPRQLDRLPVKRRPSQFPVTVDIPHWVMWNLGISSTPHDYQRESALVASQCFLYLMILTISMPCAYFMLWEYFSWAGRQETSPCVLDSPQFICSFLVLPTSHWLLGL